MLTALGRVVCRNQTSPWSPVVGVARSLIAFATAATVAMTPPEGYWAAVFRASGAQTCRGAFSANFFCVTRPVPVQVARWLFVSMLCAVVVGWRPRVTALPHAWLTWSLSPSILVDGGDQIASTMSILLLPLLLTDPRRWHWQRHELAVDHGPVAPVVARTALALLRIQIAGIYFVAGIAKLGQPTWADGTALYYWLNDPAFGTRNVFAGLAHWLTYTPAALLVITWGTIAIEVALGVSIVMHRRVRPWLWPVGVALHIMIAVLIGLTSFALVMIGALTLLLLPPSFKLPSLAHSSQHVPRSIEYMVPFDKSRPARPRTVRT